MAPDSRRGRADGEARGLEPPPSLRGVTVLLVEDDPDSRAFVERVLRDAHAAVVAVASGFEGLLSLVAAARA